MPDGEPNCRTIADRYRDPLDELWLETARRIGLRVERTDAAYATTDGEGQVAIGNRAHLDADDSLAQMIFHELCHSLVQGRESFDLPDWGLENADERDVPREHACLRAQAHLAARHGLRRVLAPTTDFRQFYDALGPDPLQPRASKSTQLAIVAVTRSRQKPWEPHLDVALAATAAICLAAKPLWPPGSLLAKIESPPQRHSCGLSGGFVENRTCGECGWRDSDGSCANAGGPVVAAESACDRFEPVLECESCGACCREGYGSVTVEKDDPVIDRHPTLIVRRESYVELRRNGGRCIALEGEHGSFACSIYADRPRCCRELERGGEHCLTARRRVGLSI